MTGSAASNSGQARAVEYLRCEDGASSLRLQGQRSHDAEEAREMRSASQAERGPAMVKAPSVTISVALCKACGICVALCPKGVLVEGAGGVPEVANGEACTGCRICELHCPDLAIGIIDAGAVSPTADTDAEADADADSDTD